MLLLGLKIKQVLWKRVLYLLAAIVILSVGSNMSFLFLIWLLGAGVSVLPLVFSSRVAKWGSWLFATILAIAFVGVRRNISNLHGGEIIIGLIFAVLLYLILHEQTRVKHGVYFLTATFISKISYTLYLVHLPILVFLCALFNNPWRIWPKTASNVSISLTVFALTVTMAYLFYCMFESNTDRCRKYVSLILATLGVKGLAPSRDGLIWSAASKPGTTERSGTS